MSEYPRLTRNPTAATASVSAAWRRFMVLIKLADGLELGSVGGLGPLEEHGLGGRDDGPGPFKPA